VIWVAALVICSAALVICSAAVVICVAALVICVAALLISLCNLRWALLWYKKRGPSVVSAWASELIPGSDLLSHAPARAVPSAVAGLTSVFGMGTGVTLLLWPPGNLVSGVPAPARDASYGEGKPLMRPAVRQPVSPKFASVWLVQTRLQRNQGGPAQNGVVPEHIVPDVSIGRSLIGSSN
jgi:hypothetical protein